MPRGQHRLTFGCTYTRRLFVLTVVGSRGNQLGAPDPVKDGNGCIGARDGLGAGPSVTRRDAATGPTPRRSGAAITGE